MNQRQSQVLGRGRVLEVEEMDARPRLLTPPAPREADLDVPSSIRAWSVAGSFPKSSFPLAKHSDGYKALPCISLTESWEVGKQSFIIPVLTDEMT